ncbi:hypothetical protein K501DRAFT_273756 [Backusella circina FSU 941]|nr:hypothetical protein K501DRAFT_273756 [Backusella circina FSU 941]
MATQVFREHQLEPKSIKELSLTSNVFIDTIDLLCEAELQLTKLTLSTPVGFYSSMTLLDGFINEESYNTCDDPSMIEFLETMTGLTSLNTTFNPKILKNRIISVSVTTLDLTLTKVRSRQAQSIDMDRILIAFPSLMSLNLSCPNTIVTANPDNDDIQSHPSLRHVELQCESIDTSATRLLGRVAPNLKTMKWIVTARRGGKAQIKFIMENKRSKDLEYTIDITALKLEAFDFAYNNYHGDHIYRSRLCLEAHKLEGKRQQYVYAMSFGGVLTPISNDPEDSDDNFDGEDFINLMPKVKVLYDSIGVLRFQGHELS